MFTHRLWQVSQAFHLVCLFCIPILYALLKMFSEPHDVHAAYVAHAVILGGTAWGALVIVATVRTGSEIDARANLFALYRRLLLKDLVLLILNLILGAALVTLGLELLFYRQVTFVSNSPATVMINDSPGRVLILGAVSASEPKTFRVKTGTRSIVARNREDKLAKVDNVFIPSICSSSDVPEVDIKFEELSYETLRPTGH